MQPPAAVPWPAAEPQAAQLLATLGVALLCAWSVFKGVMWGFHSSENYFWITTYAHGLVRRALAGTLLAPLLAHAGMETVQTVVLGINRAALGMLAMLLLLTMARQTRYFQATALLAAVFAAAPFLGQTAFLVGFPDGLIALLLAALICAAWRGPWPLVAALSLIGALFHEFIPLVALPAMALAACLRPSIRLPARLAIVGAPAAATVFMALAGRASPAAVQSLVQHLVALGDTPAEALYQANWRLTQSTGGDIALVGSVWRDFWVNGLIGLAYAVVPTLVLGALGWPRLRAALAARDFAAQNSFRDAIRNPRGTSGTAFARLALIVLAASACLAPLAILLIAIDLSRLAGFTALTTLLTILMLPPAPLPRGGRAAGLVTIAVFALLPVYNMHLPYASAAHLRLLAQICPVCSRGFVNFLDFYNRYRTPEQRAEVLTNPAYANLP